MKSSNFFPFPNDLRYYAKASFQIAIKHFMLLVYVTLENVVNL